MSKSKESTSPISLWLSKGWIQWLLAIVFFFLLSWLYMGSAINDCTTTTTALGSDSTGGLAWIQWASGNDLSWDFTNKSNFPDGEELSKPQQVTSAIFVLLYKLFASLSTPICGLNLIVLLGYMSTGLLMFGLIKWLLKRFDIALFAGFAAAFVPFHVFKAQSHVNYVYGSIFIAIIWAYFWFLSRPSYKRAITLGLVNAIGFYFDGYYIFFSGVLIGALLASSFVFDFFRLMPKEGHKKEIVIDAWRRLKYIMVSIAVLAVLLLPIVITYKANSEAINQSLNNVRSNIKVETLIYGTRPIEFVLPSYNSFWVPDSYQAWRATKLHASNYSESTLYIGITVILLAVVGVAAAILRKYRKLKLQNIAYPHLVLALVIATACCFLLSVPATAYLFGRDISTPVDLLVKLTANWRTISRMFLVIDPLVIVAASLGLYIITNNLSRVWRISIVAACGLVLFFEYLPSPLHTASDFNKSVPPVYQQLKNDKEVKVVAEYPLADFKYTPEIFTYQPYHQKILMNANEGNLSRGPFKSAIAGLNDPQTIGTLKQLEVDLVITHGFESNNPDLISKYGLKPIRDNRGKINQAASTYAYEIDSQVVPRSLLLVIDKGYESLSVDEKQISHRAVTQTASLRVVPLVKDDKINDFRVQFAVNSLCPSGSRIKIGQSNRILWEGKVSQDPAQMELDLAGRNFQITTELCSIDITKMQAKPRP